LFVRRNPHQQNTLSYRETPLIVCSVCTTCFGRAGKLSRRFNMFTFWYGFDNWSVEQRTINLMQNERCKTVIIAQRTNKQTSHDYIRKYFFRLVALQPNARHGLLILDEVSRSHSDLPHSMGVLWMSDQPVAVISTWQHTTLTTDKHPCPGRIRTHNLRM